jgi:hypothetical protein
VLKIPLPGRYLVLSARLRRKASPLWMPDLVPASPNARRLLAELGLLESDEADAALMEVVLRFKQAGQLNEVTWTEHVRSLEEQLQRAKRGLIEVKRRYSREFDKSGYPDEALSDVLDVANDALSDLDVLAKSGPRSSDG